MFTRAGQARATHATNLTVLIACAIVIYNGLNNKGFADNFFVVKEDPGTELYSNIAEPAGTILLVVTVAIVGLLGILFLLATVNKVRDPGHHSTFGKPWVHFLLVHAVLIPIGFMVSAYDEMTGTAWILVASYAIYLSIGAAAVAVRVLADHLQSRKNPCA